MQRKWIKAVSLWLAILQMLLLVQAFIPAGTGAAAEGAFRTVMAPVMDAHVNSGSSTTATNYGKKAVMELKEGGGAFNRRIFLQFPAVNAGPFNQAILRLYFNDAGPLPQELSLYAVTDEGWTEDGLTYANQPPHSEIVGKALVGGAPGWYQWNVTDYVLSRNSGEVISFMLKGTNTSSNRTVSSKEGANPPQLILDYDVTAPVLEAAAVSGENRRLELRFNEYLRTTGLNGLLPAISLSRDGNLFTPLSPEDSAAILGDTLSVVLADRLSLPGAKVRINANALSDEAGNAIGHELLIGELAYDATAPVLSSSVETDRTNRILTVSADEPLFRSASDEAALKAAVSFAQDGIAYAPLKEGDTAALADGKLVVTLESKLAGNQNKLRIEPDALKDEAGNLVGMPYVSDFITADTAAPVLEKAYAVNMNRKIMLVFDEPVFNALSDETAFHNGVYYSDDNGGEYRPLNAADHVSINGQTVSISLDSPIAGEGNRIRLAASSIMDALGNKQKADQISPSITAADTAYPYPAPLESTLELAMMDSANIIFGNKDAAQGSFSELRGSKSFEAIVQAVLSGNRDPMLVERCVEVIRKMLTIGANMPNLQAGLDSRGHSSMVSSAALLWNDEEIMSLLTEQERSKLAVFFKAALISTVFTTSEYDQYGSRRTAARLAMNGDPNTYTGNPNYWEPNMTLLYASSFVLGTENVKGLLQQYDHGAFVQELMDMGLTSVYASFASTLNFGSQAAKAAMVEGIVRNPGWSFKGVTLDEFLANPMRMFAKAQDGTWDHIAQDGDYMGEPGMEHEFASSDADGPRESATYAVLGIDPSLQNRMLMHMFGYWNAPGNEAMRDRIAKLQAVGVSDYYAKTVNGYYSQSRAGTKTEHTTADIYLWELLISIGGMNPAAFHDSFDYKEGVSALTDHWVPVSGAWKEKQAVIIPYNVKDPLTRAAGAVPFDPLEQVLAVSDHAAEASFIHTKAHFGNISYLAWVRPGHLAGEFGIAGRVQDGSNYYLLSYGNGKLSIKSVTGGVTQTLAEEPIALNPGVSYRFRGVFTGDTIELHLNGQKKLTAHDSRFGSGAAGLYSERANASFDAVLIQPTTMPEGSHL
ncbi:DNRLRE domain-containing protein [Paenibacillus mesotrionivorans]|uniref:DNRLRE domain-containing protein n=1 Tax=Paenibacillus mesotrionivorans TaxID=3160968 RepID=A0ACC7P2K9_9BACL